MNRFAPAALALALAAGIVADVVAEPGAPRSPLITPAPTGLSVVCPLAADTAARGFVHLANIGDEAARVKLSVVPRAGRWFVSERRLAPGAVRTVRVSGRVAGRASAIVEAVGGEVVATHSLWYRTRVRTGPLRDLLQPRGAGAAPCTDTGPATLTLPHLSTRDADAVITLFNPGAARAEVGISLIVGNRVVRPETLRVVGISSRATVTVSVGDHVFNADEVTAVIEHAAGRVAAEALRVTRGGVALVPAVEPVAGPLVVAGATGRGAMLGLAAPGPDDTGLAANVVGARDQGRARGIPADLAPSTGARRNARSIGGGGPAGYLLEATVGGPLTVGASWPVARAGGTDLAASAHGPQVRRWAAVFGAAAADAVVRVVVVNHGSIATTARIRRLGADGVEEVRVPAGRLRRVVVARGDAPAAIVVDAGAPVAVLLEAAASELVGGVRTVHAVGLEGIPLPGPAPAPVVIEPRAGVPAPLTRREPQ